MTQLTYKIRLQKEKEGGYTVSVPSLPGCITYGDSIDDEATAAPPEIHLKSEVVDLALLLHEGRNDESCEDRKGEREKILCFKFRE